MFSGIWGERGVAGDIFRRHIRTVRLSTNAKAIQTLALCFFFFAFVTPIRVSCNYRTTKVLLIETAPKFFRGKLCDLCKNDFWVQVSQINIQTNFNLSECFLKCSYERRNSTPPLWSSGPVFLNLCQWFDQHSAQFEHDSSNLLSWRYKGSNK